MGTGGGSTKISISASEMQRKMADVAAAAIAQAEEQSRQAAEVMESKLEAQAAEMRKQTAEMAKLVAALGAQQSSVPAVPIGQATSADRDAVVRGSSAVRRLDMTDGSFTGALPNTSPNRSNGAVDGVTLPVNSLQTPPDGATDVVDGVV